MEVDSEQLPIPHSVIDHFRNLRHIVKLKAGPPVRVFAKSFEDRGAYMSGLLGWLRRRRNRRRVVFLDPDTGLEPTRNPDHAHVLESEVRKIWEIMAPGEILALYQHQTNRRGEPWIEPKRVQFERALGLPKGAAKLARAPSIARDVVLFFAMK